MSGCIPDGAVGTRKFCKVCGHETTRPERRGYARCDCDPKALAKIAELEDRVVELGEEVVTHIATITAMPTEAEVLDYLRAGYSKRRSSNLADACKDVRAAFATKRAGGKQQGATT